MIRSDNEYKAAVERIRAEKQALDAQRLELKRQGHTADEIKRATDPFHSFHLQLVEEVEHYESLRRGQVPAIDDLRNIGQLLISLRIAAGLSQRELAERLGVHESQISRDERNEYSGVTIERAAKILDTLNADVNISASVHENAPN
jgi:DNA-directed RNA polymerase specialized sigma subunit